MINRNWDIILHDEFNESYYKNLNKFIKKEYKNKTIYPEYSNIFRSLNLSDYNEIKVVIIGQDPYHGKGEANGLSFSVNEGVRIPPSLRNIFKELYNDLNINRTKSDLTDWAEQGVLLLNSIMTVEKDKPLSHSNKGWETFTNKIIKKLSSRDMPIVFVLWGNYAKSKKDLIDTTKHKIIESAHPSPFSAYRGFFGSKPFSKINNYLNDFGYKQINW